MIPVNIGFGPYGFMARNQAMRVDLGAPEELASKIAKVLAKSPSTQSLMAESLVVALEQSSSYAQSRAAIGVLEETPSFSDEQLQRLDAAISSNDQVSRAFYVPDGIRRVIARHRSR